MGCSMRFRFHRTPLLVSLSVWLGLTPLWGQAASNATVSDALATARGLLERGEAQASETAVRGYLHAHPESADAHFLLGYVLFREIQARVPQEKYPDGVAYHAPSVADVQARDEKARASLAEYTAGARLRRPDALDLKIVALDYVLLHDFRDADRWLSLSLAWNSSDAQGWYYLGRTKYNESRFAEAIPAFEHSLRLDPRNVRNEDNLGLAYEAMGRNGDAMTAYRQAIAWQAQSAEKIPEPLIDLGNLLLKQNRTEEAVPYLTRAVSIAPGIARTHRDLGKAYEKMNKLPLARTEFETAVKLAPDSAALHFLLGQVYRKEGQMDKAKAEFALCTRLQGTHSSDDQAQ